MEKNGQLCVGERSMKCHAGPFGQGHGGTMVLSVGQSLGQEKYQTEKGSAFIFV
jgi:hypothetical protein